MTQLPLDIVIVSPRYRRPAPAAPAFECGERCLYRLLWRRCGCQLPPRHPARPWWACRGSAALPNCRDHGAGFAGRAGWLAACIFLPPFAPACSSAAYLLPTKHGTHAFFSIVAHFTPCNPGGLRLLLAQAVCCRHFRRAAARLLSASCVSSRRRLCCRSLPAQPP